MHPFRLIVLALGSAALLAAGCDRGPRGPRSRLTVAIPRDVGPLSPYIGDGSVLLGLVYDKLFEPSPFVPEPGPGLAESATQVDSITWLVRLRGGVTWHDGAPFTAEDVRFTFQYYRDGPPNRYTHHVSAVPRIERIEVEGPLAVRFVCAYPCPLLARVTFADLPILPKHIWERITEPRKYAALPVGTGPYRLAEYQPDRYYKFVANGKYFLGRARAEELVMPIVPEQSATFIALRTARVDAAARDLPPELVAQFSRLPQLSIIRTSSLSIIELRPNFTRPPFDIAAFRRALSLAVNRDTLVRTVLLGQGRPGTRGYPHPDSPWSNPDLRTPFDRASAVRLLDSLGFRDRDRDGVRETAGGSPLSFVLKVNLAEPTWIRMGEMLVGQLAAVGVRLRLETLEAGVLSTQTSARDFDLFIGEAGAHGAADPDQFVMALQSGYLWRDGLPYPELDSLIAAWKRASTVDARRSAGFALQALFNERPTSIALAYPDQRWAVRPEAYDGWVESPGYGIVHKWSFLPPESRVGTGARAASASAARERDAPR
ncbi:MAG: ABC transporter substrate-binding protein [Gemmatimonadaceae bacterium]